MRRASPSPRTYCLIIGGVLLALILIDRIAAAVLPPSVTHYRAWEYMMGAHRFGLPRAGQSITMTEVGDLGNMLGVESFFEQRESTFSLDSRGHRNPPAVSEELADILIVGNSFTAGAGNDDAALLAVRLAERTGLTVRAYAPADITVLLADHEFALPRLVIWERVERNLIAGDAVIADLAARVSCEDGPTERERFIASLKPSVKRVVGPPMEYALTSVLRRSAQRAYRSARFALTGTTDADVVIGQVPEPMLFFGKDVRLLGQTAEQRGMSDVIAAILHVHHCLTERGTRFVVLPVPDKSHIYRSWVPDAPAPLEEDPLDVLAVRLQEQGIAVIPLLSAYQQAAADTSQLLYWRDDTHWNAAGIEVAAQEIEEWLNDEGF